MPVGGGGLAAGIAIALADLRPEVRLVGVQAARCAPLAGETVLGYTIADGIAVKQPGALTRPVLDDGWPRSSRSRTSRLRSRSCSCSSARSSWSKAPVPRRSPRSSPASSTATGPCAAPVRWQHRRHRARPGRAPRSDPGGPLSRSPHANGGSSRPARGAADAARQRGGSQRRRGAPPQGGRGHRGLGDRDRADPAARDEEHCRAPGDMASWGYPAVRVR